jgi:hypothetical protein
MSDQTKQRGSPAFFCRKPNREGGSNLCEGGRLYPLAGALITKACNKKNSMKRSAGKIG